jgi:hypothetical protein
MASKKTSKPQAPAAENQESQSGSETQSTAVSTRQTSAPQAVAKSGSILPSLEGASKELVARMTEVQENLESVENFRLPRAKMTADGIELIEGEAPLKELEGVIIHTKKTNVYYEKPYNPSDIQPPDCFSLDGNVPENNVPKKQHATCKGCPQAEFGTNSMKSGKACRNLKPIYLLLSDEAIMPRQFTVTPSSLKAANQYLLDLTERGIAYRKVKTKITLFKENPKDTYYKIKFAMGSKLNEQQLKNVEFLRNQWLPIMNAQLIDQTEFDNASASPAAATNAAPSGEY